MIESYCPAHVNLLDLDLARFRKGYSPEPVLVEGVVSPDAQVTMSARVGGGYRIHLFDLSAWRRIGGPLISTRIVVLRAIPNLPDFAHETPPLAVERMNVLLFESAGRAILVNGCSDPVDSGPFQSVIDRLRHPATASHPVFGALRFEPVAYWYWGEVTWMGQSVTLIVDAEGAELRGPSLSLAESMWEELEQWDARARSFMLEHVRAELDAYPPTMELDRRITLKSIHFSKRGATFSFRDGGLFGGHSIVVRTAGCKDSFDFSIEG